MSLTVLSSISYLKMELERLLIYICPSHKRLTQQKRQRERERKELDTLGRRHLANVRVVQRNVVYVVGIGPRFAKEEVCTTLTPRGKLTWTRQVAYPYFAINRIFWPIRQDLEDPPRKTYTIRRRRPRRRPLYNLPQEGRCIEVYRRSRWNKFTRRRKGSYARELWDYEILYGVFEGRGLC